jgi:ferredoxin-NADP reductase
VLIAAGIGITPLRAIFATAPAAPGQLTLIYRARRENEVVFHQELDAIAESRDARIAYLIGSRTDPDNQLTPQRLQTLCPEIADAHVYICGGDTFVASVTRAAITHGVPARNIRSEFFRLQK